MIGQLKQAEDLALDGAEKISYTEHVRAAIAQLEKANTVEDDGSDTDFM